MLIPMLFEDFKIYLVFLNIISFLIFGHLNSNLVNFLWYEISVFLKFLYIGTQIMLVNIIQ